MRIVLDTNIYVSNLISERGNPAKIVRWWLEGQYDVLVSQPVIDEILRVTGYERIQKKYSQVRENRLEFAALIAEQALWIEPQEKLDVISSDQSDNRYVECAVAGGANYIITGDEHLLELGEYEGIMVLTPAAFVALMEADQL
ncbi:MAG: putative toxin-antitoxin system toxin component, PIN family [Chloroflexota bacterium]|nr:MAG: putative toxin-antitoxin system toxin component, PIN family [Chloroflexota bacterium]